MKLKNNSKKGGENVAGQYKAGGITVVCPHCENKVFEEGKAQLNTAIATFFNLDWANRSAYTLMCVSCGNIQWFAGPLEKQQKTNEVI